MTNASMTDTVENTLFDYSPVTERPPIRWPGGARVASYVGLNVEHFLIDRPSTSIWSGTADLVPDALNHGWRDYGPRVGIWRTVDGPAGSAPYRRTRIRSTDRRPPAPVRDRADGRKYVSPIACGP